MMQFHLTFLQSGQSLPVSFNTNGAFNLGFKNYQAIAVGEYYEGDYEVTPKVDAQILATRQKLMKSDLTIKEIPYFDVTNNAGGSTVYIASLEEMYGAVLGTAVLGTMII